MTEKLAYVVDFDGTVTVEDISTALGSHFGGARYREIDRDYRRRKMGMRGWLRETAALLPADFDLLLSLALERAHLRPGFDRFVRSARERQCPVYIASDGFGFYIEPILERFGCLEYIEGIYRNELVKGEGGRLKVVNPHAHPTCSRCGNCKAALVLKLKEEGRRVVYIGDGSNDRFGASWSDCIFARDELAGYCSRYGLPFFPWTDFNDISGAVGRGFENMVVKSPFCNPAGEGYIC